MMNLLSRWLGSKPRYDVAHLRVTIYSRDQCCCCQTARDLLSGYRRRHRFQIEEVDVDSDPVLAGRYGTEVPVVAVNGKVRFKGEVNPVLFERLLAAESRDRGEVPAGEGPRAGPRSHRPAARVPHDTDDGS